MKTRSSPFADIAIWGRIPPPIGGMAVHLQRLLPYLVKEGISVQMYSIGRRTPDHPAVRQVWDRRFTWFVTMLLGRCEPVHYVLSNKTSARFAASLLSTLRRGKVILRIGGGSLESAAKSRNPINRALIRYAIRRADIIVGVSPNICKIAHSLGAQRVEHIPGFIPAPYDHVPLPKTVESFLSQASGPVLLASGEITAKQEDDVYGAYFLLDLLERMRDINLVFYAYTITRDQSEQEPLIAEIHRRGLAKRFLLFSSTTEMLPAMRRCHIFVRPTRSDGDSNSIREALYAGLPVIASDCVTRPPGVVTFSSGNLGALENAIDKILSELDVFKEKLTFLPKENNAETLVELFKELLDPMSPQIVLRKPCETKSSVWNYFA